MPETDADQFLAAAVQFPHEFHQGSYPGLVIVDAGFAAGDQVGIDLIDVGRILALRQTLDRDRAFVFFDANRRIAQQVAQRR